MRVVVTGASGNVGSALLERLEDESAVDSVVGVVRRVPDWRPSKVTWHRADVGHDDLGEAVRGADAVVHLAWLFQPTRRPAVTWQSNVVGTERVLDAVAAEGVPTVVVASSVGAYSPRRDLAPVDETWPTRGCPSAAYSREKAYVERVLDVHESAHPERRVVRVRPAFIFQPASARQQRRLFLGPLVPRTLLRRGLLPAVPLPRDLHLQALHARDVADAYARIVTRDVRGAFNLAPDDALSPTGIAEVLGARPVTVPDRVARTALAGAYAAHAVPASPGLLDLALAVPMMDAGRAHRELGWTPEHDSARALAAFLAGTEQGSDGPTPPLAASTSGPARTHELATGIGHRP